MIRGEFAVLRIDPSFRKTATTLKQARIKQYLLIFNKLLSDPKLWGFFAALHQAICGNAKNLPCQSVIATDASLIQTAFPA